MNFPTFLIRGLASPLKFTLAGFTMTALAACSLLDNSLRQASTPLPIEVQHSGSGRIRSVRAHETSSRLYVSGCAGKHRLSNNAHVDIQLIGSAGEVLAEGRNAINPAHPAHGGGKRFTDSYVVSFPLSEARQAVKIRVVYHSGSHPKGNS